MSVGSYVCCGCNMDVSEMDLVNPKMKDSNLECEETGYTGPLNCGGNHPEPLECPCGTYDHHSWCVLCRVKLKER